MILRKITVKNSKGQTTYSAEVNKIEENFTKFGLYWSKTHRK